MRVLIQRVKEAQVRVAGEIVGAIDRGLLVFLGIHHADDAGKIAWLIQKLSNLRIFSDDEGKMNLSVKDIQGKVLIVSQFTLYADCETGRRPSFIETMPPQEAEKLYEAFIKEAERELGKEQIATGRFGAFMEISLINEGPATFLLTR